MPSSNPLPAKENSLFKRILKCYELKQYKNGLKFAKQILLNPKFSEHGETLAMKGLILNCLGRKTEAYDHVRRGLRNDLCSHVCWHVYGLLQRAEKKYEEAIKCYRNALKWDKDNIQILKDLSLLQIQMRDLEGYRDTRYQLFILRPAQRLSWIGFAMAYHLLNDYDMTLKILKTFLTVSAADDFEHSELLLYQNMVYQESGAFEDAIKHLDSNNLLMYDKLTVNETYGDLYLKVGKFSKAQKYYEDLIERNQENVEYYKKLQQALLLTTNDDKFEMLNTYRSKYPQAHAPRRLALNVCTGDKFRTEVDQYLRRGLHKGVPPLFVDLESLYKDPSKVTTIETLVESYVEALKKTGYFSFEDAEKSLPKEPASALLWTYYFLAQHYDFLRNTEKALYFIDLAIEHTPTLIELFVVKGKIHKHAGDVEEAYKWLDEAQGLDTADRYINSKCAKYMLRANLIQQAEEMCAKFTREGVSAMENLNEMQCMWFQTECALAYQRLKKWGEALKKCHEVDRHFTEIFDDQVDFHTYCMRKMTLRSYVGLLRLEDVLRSHPFYIRAAICAISVYLHLDDKPTNSHQDEHHQNTENLTPVEYKKLKLKQKRARKRAEKKEAAEREEAEEKREQTDSSRLQQQQRPRKPGRHTGGDVEQDAPKLEKLIPEKLARVDDPLEQAIKFLKPLQLLASNRIETHLMAFEIYFRKEKPLIMLQSIKRAHRLAPNDSTLHSCLVRFLLWRSNNGESLSPNVAVVIDNTLNQLLGNTTDAHELNSQFLQKNSNSLSALFEGSKMMYLLDPSKKEEAVSLATKMDDKLEGVSINLCTKIVESLREGAFGNCEKEAEEYRKLCHVRFPLATAFKPVNSKNAPSAKQWDSNVLESQENCLYN